MHRQRTRLAARVPGRAQPVAKAVEKTGIVATYQLHDRLLSNRGSRRLYADSPPSLGDVQRRIVVSAKGVGLTGESDLASSYAIYTLLHDLGCRWFMPGPLGEVLPMSTTLKVPVRDVSSGPYTHFRGLWYCDNDYARRNRLHLCAAVRRKR